MSNTVAIPQLASGPIPSLDGLRAIAVSLVFFAHSQLEYIIPGGLGVTIFFVLSGYLITTLMRVEYARSGRVSFRWFYLRRCLRLLPPLLITVAAAGVLSGLMLIDGAFSPRGLLAVLFYFGNYHVIAENFQGIPAGLGVVWSLAVEEHFYLLFPPLAVLLLRSGSRQLAAATLTALCAAVLAWRCHLVLDGAPVAHITMATDTRIDAILVGCLMALACNPWLDHVPPPHRWRDGSLAAVCLAVLSATLLYRNDFFRNTARYTLQSLAIAPLIYLAVARATCAPFRWLNARPMVYLGVTSYAIYLTHQVILLGIERHWPRFGWLGTTLIGAALTLTVAELLRRWIEEPCARLRKSLHRDYTSSVPATARA